MSLTTLPPELLSCVVANIKSQPTLCNLTECSRQFYLITIPHLYHDITIRQERWPEKQGKLQNLASLLLRRPDLARLVRCFTLNDRSYQGGAFKDFQNPETIEVDQAFKTAVNALDLSKEEEDSWLGQLSHTRKCDPDLILALLLPALLKVERLVLDISPGPTSRCLERIIRRAARRERPFDLQPAFERLKVFIQTHESAHMWSPGFFVSLLKLPDIRVIIGRVGKIERSCGYLGEDYNPVELDNISSRLVTLDLGAYNLSAASLGHFLRAPKALKTFFYKVCPFDSIKFPDIHHALRPQENCLWSLGFDCDEIYSVFTRNNWRDDDFYGPMTSFISFNTLKIFKVAELFLQTTVNGTERQRLINIFPPNLETLHVTRCQNGFESLIEAVEYLLARKSPQQLPFLKELILEESKGMAPWSIRMQETTMAGLFNVAADRGFSIVLK